MLPSLHFIPSNLTKPRLVDEPQSSRASNCKSGAGRRWKLIWVPAAFFLISLRPNFSPTCRLCSCQPDFLTSVSILERPAPPTPRELRNPKGSS